MKKTFILRILSALALIGCIIFIFHNSLQPGVVSEVKSEETTGFLRKILGFVMSKFLQDDHYVRKLAHVIEFLVLGILVMLNIKVWNAKKRPIYAFAIFFGALIGSIDETIQLFVPGRSAEIKDVLIDFSGFVVGFFLCLMLSLWYNKSQCAKKST